MDQFGIDALFCPPAGNGRRALDSSGAPSFSGNEHGSMMSPSWMAVCSPNRALHLCKLTYRYREHHVSMGTSCAPWISGTLLVYGPFWVEEVFFVHGWECYVLGLNIMWVSLSAPNGFKPLIHSMMKGKHPSLSHRSKESIRFQMN